MAPVVRQPVPFEVLSNSGDLFEALSDGELVAPLSEALRSDAEQKNLLSVYPRRTFYVDERKVVSPFPEIDYSIETALVLTEVPAASTVTLRLDSVIAEGNTATVYATKVVPCINTRDLVNKTLVATIPGPGRRVAFAARRLERGECR